ncbi:MAG: NAD-dependent DNA ligase LigA [Bacteroidales bacterium]|jgi:DNA ligase (NAD+)
MKKSEADALEKISRLREVINIHNRRYYIENKPVISDFEYDVLMTDLQALESKYPQFATEKSPTNSVGSDLADTSDKAEFIQVHHKYPMLSLSNTYDKGELLSFNERIKKIINKPFNYVCELKIDGTAISLSYINGRLVSAVTRGDGTVGDDVTRNVKMIPSIPVSLKGDSFPSEFDIRGEIFMPWSAFEDINKRRSDNEDLVFANPRNAAAGSLKLLDSDEISKRGLMSILYHIVTLDVFCESHFESLILAGQWGLPVSPYTKLCKSIDEVMDYLDYWDIERKSLPYPTDGVVIKVDNLNYQKILGFTAKSPRWATAFKFKAEQAISRVLSIDYQVGRTGAITPVANLEPVLLSGSTVKRASLHNSDQIKLLDIHINDFVFVEKGGEIIPKIVSVDKSRRGSDLKTVIFPESCPDCGTILVREESEAKQFCPNQSGCPTQIKARFLHFTGRKALDILIGEATIDQLFNLNYIRKLSDLFKLEKDQLMNLEGWKERSADRFLESIDKSRKSPFYKILFSLGIRYIGETTAKNLANHFKTIDKIISATKEELLNVEEVGEIMVESLINYFSNTDNIELINELKEQGLIFEQDDQSNSIVSDKLRDNNIVVTGNFSVSREEIKRIISFNSGRVVSSVSSNTNYLLAGEKPGPGKIQKAEKLGIKIISEDDFNKML